MIKKRDFAGIVKYLMDQDRRSISRFIRQYFTATNPVISDYYIKLMLTYADTKDDEHAAYILAALIRPATELNDERILAARTWLLGLGAEVESCLLQSVSFLYRNNLMEWRIRNNADGYFNMRNEDLRDLNFKNLDLSYCAMQNTNLDGNKTLEDAYLEGADLLGASLRYAVLSGANLMYANFTQAILIGADLRGAVMFCACFANANLQEANLAHGDLMNANLVDANFRGANLNMTEMLDANLKGAILAFASLKGATVIYACLDYADLSYANCENAKFHSSSVKHVDFRHARLSDAEFDPANLTGTRLELAASNLEISADEAKVVLITNDNTKRQKSKKARHYSMFKLMEEDAYISAEEMAKSQFGRKRA